MTSTLTGPTRVDYALAYAEAGYLVLPLHSIDAPASADVVARWRAGELTKKQAVIHAQCTCGKPDCASPGKHPLTAHGARDATLDPAVIAAWWAEWPDANIGLRMPPGRVALDFDFYSAGAEATYDALLESDAFGKVPTALQESGSHGMHILFSCPENAGFQTSLDGRPGVDIIHAGHRYIVAEPSRHWTGQVYEWLTPPDRVSPIQPSLLARCVRGAPRSPSQSLSTSTPGAYVSKYVGVKAYDPDAPRQVLACPPGVPVEQWAVCLAATLPPAVSSDAGGAEHGHATLARAARHLIAGLGLDPPQAVEILWAHYNPRCEPPWEENAADRRDSYEDFERTVLSGGRGLAPEEVGYLLPKAALPVEPPPAQRAAIAELPADVDPLTQIGRIVDRSKPPEPLQWRVHDVLAPGKVSILVGPPEASKGPFALWLSLCVAAGVPAFGSHAGELGRWAPKQCPVVYADSETGSLAEERDLRMCNALGVVREDVPLTFLHLEASFDPAMLGALHAGVVRRGAGLLIIDTYGSTLPGDIEHNDAQFSWWLKELGKLSRDTGVTVLVIMHAKKGSGGPDLELISGHYSAAGAAQTVIALRQIEDQVVEVRCARHPRAKWKPFHVRWEDVSDPDGGKYAGVRLDGVSWGLRPAVVDKATEEDTRMAGTRTANAARQQEKRAAVEQGKARLLRHMRPGMFYPSRDLEAIVGQRNVTREALADLNDEGVIVQMQEGWKRVGDDESPTTRFMARSRR